MKLTLYHFAGARPLANRLAKRSHGTMENSLQG